MIGRTSSGDVPQVTLGRDVGGVDDYDLVIGRACIGSEAAPIGDRRIPLRAFGCHRPALEIGERSHRPAQ